MGTNIDGNRKVMFAMTAIKGVGRRYANIVLKKADIDLDKRAGECSEEEVSPAVLHLCNEPAMLMYNKNAFRSKKSSQSWPIPGNTKFLIGSSIGRRTSSMESTRRYVYLKKERSLSET